MGKTKTGVTGGEGEGNTNFSFQQDSQAKRWCFTLNNYSENDIKNLELSFIGGKYIIAKEIGESGTPHLQGYINMDKQTRLSALKKIHNKIHWEKCKGSEKDNIKYCSKDGDYIIKGLKVEKQIKIITKLHPWQQEIEELYKTEPDGRTINWYWEDKGGVGKSSFCKYMYVTHGAITIQGGKLADIMNIIFNLDMNDVTMLIIDVPRNNGNNISYSAVECILNGMITNTKFETGVKVFNAPHVVVFSNFEPDTEKLSEDRWSIKKII